MPNTSDDYHRLAHQLDALRDHNRNDEARQAMNRRSEAAKILAHNLVSVPSEWRTDVPKPGYKGSV